MSVYVFLGPTLPVGEAASVLPAVYLPPVRQGDVHRVTTLQQPRAIGIIDGYFQQVPSVWHKEILWAMSRGVHVFGASSMGALRAAELEQFGMQGVGKIVEAFRDGVLSPYVDEAFEDDDEVAVVHGPPELGYLPMSEAMVNIRCTLARAAQTGVISEPTRNALVRLAKTHFFQQRSYQRLLAQAADLGLPQDELNLLGGWLPEGRVDQKRADALTMLRTMGRFLAVEDRPKRVSYTFEHTTMWEQVVGSLETDEEAQASVLDELRLQSELYLVVRERALQRMLAIEDVSSTDSATGDARISHLPLWKDGSAEQVALDERLLGSHGNPREVDRLLSAEAERQALQQHAHSLPVTIIHRQMLAELRSNGEYDRLASRARRKHETLASAGPPPSEAELSGLQQLQLRDWYFGQHLGREMPDDLQAYVAFLGFADADHFHRALLREFAFLQEEQAAAAHS